MTIRHVGAAGRSLNWVQYLSETWLDAATIALRDAAATAPTESLVIDQHIEGATSYRITVARNAATLVVINTDAPDVAANPDAVFRQDLATATAVAQGTTDAHQAFLLGHIRFEGDINVLIERRASFEWLEDALAPVVEATTF